MLEKVDFDEAKQSQLPFIELLLNMGYIYTSAAEALKQRGGDPSNFVLTEIAAQKLMEINSYEVDGVEYKFSEKDVRDAIDELEHIQYEGLIDTAQKIYNTIMPTSGGKTIKVNHGGKKVSKNFKFIDFQNPQSNSFHVTAEFLASGKQNVRPDIVCFVNGIPFAAIENKKSSVDVKEALNQMNRNQGVEYCPKLYAFMQLLVGTNGKNLQYGTTGTPNKFYAVWKEKGLTDEEVELEVLNVMQRQIDHVVYSQLLKDLNGYTQGRIQYTSRLVTEQDKGVVFLFKPERLLDITKNYILFDAGVKKISRYQQYFAIHKMLKRVENEEPSEVGSEKREGGLLWHTQGSGKSLTMVMFVKALIEDPLINNPRVIIVTDRKDLDKQIKDTFKNCNLKKDVEQAKSGQHLLSLIQENNPAVITTLVHKFETAAKKKTGLVDKDKNIFILVDEAHRSQYGATAQEMRRILPNACFIGFTGTPLLKKDKSLTKFGTFIDKYTIDDALEDGIILPLIYEGRYVDLVQNKEQIDKHVERITAGLSKEKKAELQRYADTKIIKDNPQRITEIAFDIEAHYVEVFQGSGLKAQIVAPSKFSAILFQKYFEQSGQINTAVVISDEHNSGDEDDLHKKEVVAYLEDQKKKYSSIEKYEKDVIESFKHNPDGVEIIIVVSKLLTGFDAPCNTVLYLAKDLHDHDLLQAIARVNRLYDNEKLPKTSGYIIDYSENAKNIDTAMKLFGNYEEGDVKGTLIDVKEKIDELEQSYSKIQDVLKQVGSTTDDEAYLRFLSDEPTREIFYKSLNQFIRNLNECFVLQDFVKEFKDFDLYKRELKKLLELRKSASLLYADTEDLSEYKRSLVNILDKYVDARGVELLTKQVTITDRKQFEEAVDQLGSVLSKAEAIAAQTKKTITERMAADPEFYGRFSHKIEEVLRKMREGKLADIEALGQLKLFHDDVLTKKDTELPSEVEKNKAAGVLYRNLRESFGEQNLPEDLYIEIIFGLMNVLKRETTVDWNKNMEVKRIIKNSLDDYLYDVVKKEKGIELNDQQTSELLNEVLKLAENNTEIF